MNIIIAGNYRQYRDYIRRYNLNPKEYKYIPDAHKLRGLHNCKVICVGTYWESEVTKTIGWRELVRRAEEA